MNYICEPSPYLSSTILLHPERPKEHPNEETPYNKSSNKQYCGKGLPCSIRSGTLTLRKSNKSSAAVLHVSRAATAASQFDDPPAAEDPSTVVGQKEQFMFPFCKRECKPLRSCWSCWWWNEWNIFRRVRLNWMELRGEKKAWEYWVAWFLEGKRWGLVQSVWFYGERK